MDALIAPRRRPVGPTGGGPQALRVVGFPIRQTQDGQVVDAWQHLVINRSGVALSDQLMRFTLVNAVARSRQAGSAARQSTSGRSPLSA